MRKTVLTSLCHDMLEVGAMQLGTNHYVVTAVVPLSKDNSFAGQYLGLKQAVIAERRHWNSLQSRASGKLEI